MLLTGVLLELNLVLPSIAAGMSSSAKNASPPSVIAAALFFRSASSASLIVARRPKLLRPLERRHAVVGPDALEVWTTVRRPRHNFIRAYGTPHLLKFVQTPGLLVVLNEWNAGYRQVFTDARPLPDDPNPSWMGYSSAKWSGDTLVVDTIGLRDDSWIDWQGSVVGEAAKIREEMRRLDFGHMEIRLTVDDPKAYTKPWTVTIKERLIADAELIDEVCLENERSLQHMK